MKITIQTENAAFHSNGELIDDSYIMANQLNKIFNNIVDKVKQGETDGCELDINGNKVCKWEM